MMSPTGKIMKINYLEVFLKKFMKVGIHVVDMVKNIYTKFQLQ
jgi:hypothetical protein